MKQLLDYIKQYKKLGEREFRMQYAVSVFLGQGMVGTLQEGDKGNYGTFLTDVEGEVIGDTLRNRVIPIRKSKYGPKTKTVTIGRTEDNDIVVPDYSISKKHCGIQYREEIPMIVDFGAHNGTLVNEEQLEPWVFTPLSDYDEIIVGRYQFEFLTGDAFVYKVRAEAVFA